MYKLALLLLTSSALAQSSIDRVLAGRAFDEAHRACAADDGRLWGHSLCGPMIFVDPVTRFAVANQADQDVFHAEGGVFSGAIPKSENIANTAIDLDREAWSEILWPLPEDPERRSVLLAHESFHRLQHVLKLPLVGEAHNEHLDTVQGRYWLRLEFRALAAALRNRGNARQEAIRDALAFRSKRAELFNQASKDESALESNEGLAEYTGVKIGITDPARQNAYALQDLADGEAKPSLVRAFAYATGPAYGLLLDASKVDWRPSALKMVPISILLANTVPSDRARSAEYAATHYDGAHILAEEQAREAKANQKRAEYRARFVNDPVLHIPLQKMNIEFNPNQLFPLDDLGTVYPTLRITDLWGVLEVTSDGALLSSKWDSVTVPAPADTSASDIAAPGYKLHLNHGYRVLPGVRKGDFTVGKAETP